MKSVWKSLGTLVLVMGVLALTTPDDAWARPGGGGSSGSRGSRSFSSPSTQPLTQPRPIPQPAPQPSPMGGFWRSLAGGVVGGILGGMLFRSLGFAGGFGGFGGGFGLFDLLLLAGIGYLIYWIVRRSRTSQEATATSYYSQAPADSYGSTSAPAAALEPTYGSEGLERGLGYIRQMDPCFDEVGFKEWTSDTFFRIQAAWMHRDLEKFRPVLTEEMQEVFRKQIEDCKTKRQINKLENIAERGWMLQGSCTT